MSTVVEDKYSKWIIETYLIYQENKLFQTLAFNYVRAADVPTKYNYKAPISVKYHFICKLYKSGLSVKVISHCWESAISVMRVMPNDTIFVIINFAGIVSDFCSCWLSCHHRISRSIVEFAWTA